MNRVIKFRAWDKEEKVMISADDFCLSDEFEPLSDLIEMSQEHFVLMQYTGLNDVSNDEIYEGDIVEYHTYTGTGNLLVAWISSMFALKDKDNSVRFPLYPNDCEKINIVGNIYENPELMEKNNV
jgi:hypothetical protein